MAAVILMLLSRNAGRTGIGFLLGWIAGIVVVTSVVLVLVGQAKDSSTGPSTLSSALKLIFGSAAADPRRQAVARAPETGRGGLTQNNATVMAVLLLVIGVVLIGKGIGGLSS
jgi:hypothetical protein